MSRGIACEFQRLFGQVNELKRQGGTSWTSTGVTKWPEATLLLDFEGKVLSETDVLDCMGGTPGPQGEAADRKCFEVGDS
ncbi:unnamed protein product [Callosobruchus maculatus]|uniref:Uncharacterized protein n=1 Tax=Callosobruchus maculatus TaxID=64391 RepID=A0A653CQB6_CALMS|nr:unnamed protein product [Callosobruchus maculatus]